MLHFGHAVGGLRFGYKSSFSQPFVMGFHSVFYMGKLIGLISGFSCVLWAFLKCVCGFFCFFLF